MNLMKTTGLLTAAFGLVALFSTGALAQTAPTLTITTNGTVVDISWTAVAGATGYRLEAGSATGLSNLAVMALPANPTFLRVTRVPPGTYFVRVRGTAGTTQGSASNEVPISVAAGCSPLTAPTLSSTADGGNVTFSWTNVAGAESYDLQLSRTSGNTELAIRTSNASHTQFVPFVGTFFGRVRATNACGQAVASPEITFTVTSLCSAAAPTIAASVANSMVTFNFTNVANSSALAMEYSLTNGGPVALTEPIANPNATTFQRRVPMLGTFYGRLVRTACNVTTRTAWVAFTITNLNLGSGPRTPDPAPGTLIPRASLAYAAGVINDITNRYRGDFLNSCASHTWLYRVVQALRAIDGRWGLNYVRGFAPRMSEDIIAYNPTSLPDVDAQQVYVFDTIGGHCGPNPSPVFNDVTDFTWFGGPAGVWQGLCANRYCAQWTLDPFMAAGYQPDEKDKQ